MLYHAGWRPKVYARKCSVVGVWRPKVYARGGAREIGNAAVKSALSWGFGVPKCTPEGVPERQKNCDEKCSVVGVWRPEVYARGGAREAENIVTKNALSWGFGVPTCTPEGVPERLKIQEPPRGARRSQDELEGVRRS